MRRKNFFTVARQQGRKFFKVASRVMNESSYLFHFVQPIWTKSSFFWGGGGGGGGGGRCYELYQTWDFRDFREIHLDRRLQTK